MKLNIALIENFHEKFYNWANNFNHNIYNFSSFFKNYKNIGNYKFFKNEEIEIENIKNNILKNFGKDIFDRIDLVIFRTNVIIDKYIIDLFPNCKLYIRAGSGYDNIDHKYLKIKGIVGQNTPKANYISAAEHTLSLLLSFLKKIKYFDYFIREGFWRKDSPLNQELIDKKILIIGFGWVGRELFKMISQISSNIAIFDPYIEKEEISLFFNYIKQRNLLLKNLQNKFIKKTNDELNKILYLNKDYNVEFYNNFEYLKDNLNKMEIISLHIPLTDETYKMINYNFLEKLNENTILINVSRGEIVEEQTLISFLNEQKIKGYLADTFENEPLFFSEIFNQKYNTLFTPHIGAYTSEAKERIVNETIEVIENYFIKNKILYPFNEKFYFSKYFIN